MKTEPTKTDLLPFLSDCFDFPGLFFPQQPLAADQSLLIQLPHPASNNIAFCRLTGLLCPKKCRNAMFKLPTRYWEEQRSMLCTGFHYN